MKRMIKNLIVLCSVMAVVVTPMFAYGIDPMNNPIGKIDTSPMGPAFPVGEDPTINADIAAITLNLVNWFAWFISLVAVVMGLYSGFLFITARGETAQLATAKKTLLYAVIGIAVAVFSFSIIAVTKAFFL